jgi:translation initiation factor 1
MEAALIASSFDNSNIELTSQRVHVRVQQRNGRKFISMISGIATDLDTKRLLKHFKRNFNCTGSIILDADGNELIQLTGDQRINVKKFLIDNGIYESDQVQLHG